MSLSEPCYPEPPLPKTARLPDGTLLVEGRDFTVEAGRHVWTAAYLLARGRCCGSGCRECPWRPPPAF